MTGEIRAGVIGVGSMGEHHARVYRELPDVDLVGVCDADTDRARTVADEYQTTVRDRDSLLSAVDAASVVVPTEHHTSTATAALEQDVDVLIEKPVAKTVEEAGEIRAAAKRTDAVVQVGHIERFNPAIQALPSILDGEDSAPFAVSARRLGPPVDRANIESIVMDLMIHDIDLLLLLASGEVTDLSATSAAGGKYVDAMVEFDSGTVGSLRSSRVSQERVRDLTLTAEDYQVNVDYLDQSVQIHRRSTPEYVTEDGDVRYRNERVIEQPMVDSGEPLKSELAAFVAAVRDRSDPPVTVADGMQALELARRIESDADESHAEPVGVTLQD